MDLSRSASDRSSEAEGNGVRVADVRNVVRRSLARCAGGHRLSYVRRWRANCVGEMQAQWLAAIRKLTATPNDAARYLDGRLRFTTAVANALAPKDVRLDPLVYGVWLDGHDLPIYIGQTLEGRRRLWDLPIGESHHLANSFPPEIWSRVVAVYWGQMLSKRPALAAAISTTLNPIVEGTDSRQVIGLGLEYLLQRRYQPLFQLSKKTERWRLATCSMGGVGKRRGEGGPVPR